MAGTVLRNGPANARSMYPPMKSSDIRPFSVIHPPFSRTARRSIPAITHCSDSLSALLHEEAFRIQDATHRQRQAIIRCRGTMGAELPGSIG